jgi:hypothetical protein
MSEVRRWLEAIGLAEYADAFEANEIDMDLLGQVDDQILKDIGVSLQAIDCAFATPLPR